MATPEKILLELRPSRVIALGYYVGAAFLLILAFGLWFFSALLPALPVSRNSIVVFGGGLLTLVSILLLLLAEIRRIATKYVVTDFRVIRKEGLLRRNENAMPYTKVERINLTQGIIDRIAGIGTVVVDTGEDTLEIRSVRDPSKVQSTIMGRLQQTR